MHVTGYDQSRYGVNSEAMKSSISHEKANAEPQDILLLELAFVNWTCSKPCPI